MGRASMWAGVIIAVIFLQCVMPHREKVYMMGLGSPILSLLPQLMKQGYYGPYCILCVACPSWKYPWSKGTFVLVFLISSYKLVCYFTNWSQYRKDEGRFISEAIDPDLCTHLIYAFATVKDGEIGAKEWNDPTTYKHIKNLKSRNHNLKTLLSLGGYSFDPQKTIWKMITRSPASRSKFVMSVIKFLRDNGFDGFDLAWHTSDTKDKKLMAKLVQDLSVAFRHEAPAEKKLLLSVAVPAGREFIDTGFDIPTISQYADFLNFMTFDFHGSWENHTGHLSPLFNGRSNAGTTPLYNVDIAVKLLMSNGAPAEKIIMGIPTYGRTFTLSSTQTFVGASASGGGTPGHFTNEKGVLAYYEICDFNSLAHVEWIEEQKVPYSYKGNQWVGYENERSVKEKCTSETCGAGTAGKVELATIVHGKAPQLPCLFTPEETLFTHEKVEASSGVNKYNI